ncbi:MAG: hypothetical protein JWQ47_2094 [Glaciihabitans sp.]|nr:hypothetical protein [Glaciihabitans sp.]
MAEAQAVDADPQSFLNGLLDSVDRALPAAISGGVLTVERSRSLGDRLAGRPGEITEVRLVGASETMVLGYKPGPRWTAEIARVSGGVIISRRTLALGEWLTAFAGRIAAIAADAAGDAAASSRALQALGIQPAAADIHVGEATIENDLRALGARLDQRVPAEAAAAVRRIGELLVDTLTRVVGSGESEIIVRRTATAYLPDTLRAYLSLPADWAAGHVFPDGTTPAQALIVQLSALESAAGRMRDSAVEQDASALLVNGRFLSDRFATSSLDLS